MKFTREIKDAIHKMLLLSDAPEWKRFDEYVIEDARVLKVWLDAFPDYCSMSCQAHEMADFVELGRRIHDRFYRAHKHHVWLEQCAKDKAEVDAAFAMPKSFTDRLYGPENMKYESDLSEFTTFAGGITALTPEEVEYELLKGFPAYPVPDSWNHLQEMSAHRTSPEVMNAMLSLCAERIIPQEAATDFEAWVQLSEELP